MEVGISLTSSENAFLYLLQGANSGGAMVDKNDDAAMGSTNSGLTLTLDTGTYTSEATTFYYSVTGSFTLTVTPAGLATPPAATCFQCLVALTGELTATGQRTGDCASTHKSGRYARFYSFTLEGEMEVGRGLTSSEDAPDSGSCRPALGQQQHDVPPLPLPGRRCQNHTPPQLLDFHPPLFQTQAYLPHAHHQPLPTPDSS